MNANSTHTFSFPQESNEFISWLDWRINDLFDDDRAMVLHNYVYPVAKRINGQTLTHEKFLEDLQNALTDYTKGLKLHHERNREELAKELFLDHARDISNVLIERDENFLNKVFELLPVKEIVSESQGEIKG